MRNILNFIISMLLLPLSACDVHEWPEALDSVPFVLRLDYETDMTEWKAVYHDAEITGGRLGERYDNSRDEGIIRYVIRAYPVSAKRQAVSDHIQEFIFTKDIAEGYDHEVALTLPKGSYDIMVWSDLVQTDGDSGFYEAGDFAEISLTGDHEGNNDYRDAFKGVGTVTLEADIAGVEPDTLDIMMQRPLAKFEFVTDDLVEFIGKEARRKGETSTKSVNIEDYKVVFYYVGYMPDTYSMYTDRPVDSSTGVMFESALNVLSDGEASMGFDYVFVNDSESEVTVQVGVYDNEGKRLSLTKSIAIPLKRSLHTVLKGAFLMSEASGGVNVNPDYDGDHNIML